MNLDEYLQHFIEGYLFEDLKSMAAIRLPAGKRYGAVGYRVSASARGVSPTTGQSRVTAILATRSTVSRV